MWLRKRRSASRWRWGPEMRLALFMSGLMWILVILIGVLIVRML